jgi:hypothetical protein
MSAWLQPVLEAVGSIATDIKFFIRDDDGGWGDEALLSLLDTLATRSIPIDVAVIPMAVKHPMVDELRYRKQTAPHLLGLHQHGFQHLNHEPDGRKCEFGPSRSPYLQADDILQGQCLMREMFGPSADNIFTPPWNRCTQETVKVLQTYGFRALSRNRSATPLDLQSIRELPVALDWQRPRPDLHALALELAALIHGAAEEGALPIGIMLHHAVMSDHDRKALLQLLDLLRAQANVVFKPMADFTTHDLSTARSFRGSREA